MAIVTWLVTGASRGIGLELVKQLLTSSDNFVIATCRNPEKAAALQGLKTNAKGTLHILQLDVSKASAIRDSVKTVEEVLGDKGLDYLYNNAGIIMFDSAVDFKYEDILETFETNVAAPALMAQVYLPLVQKSARKVIVNVSSGWGSVGLDCGSVGATYSISKAALNMLTYKQAKTIPDIIAIALHPGWVKTDMGGSKAALEPHESVSAQIKAVTSVTLESSGKLLDWTGAILPP